MRDHRDLEEFTVPPARYRCNACNVNFVGHNPVATFMPPGLPTGRAGIDAQLIEKRLASQNGRSGAGHGPSIQVTLPLKWTDAGWGAIGNFGKAGFRITAHTRRRAQVAKAATGTVLHIEN